MYTFLSFLGPMSDMPLTGDLRQNNSPKRPSLDERLEKELGIKVRQQETANGIPDLSKPPPGYGVQVPIQQVFEQTPPPPEPENQRLVRVGNMLQIVPEVSVAAKIEPTGNVSIVPVPAPTPSPKQVCYSALQRKSTFWIFSL